MKYERGSFITVPSREKLRGIHPTAQALYMWLCSYANETGNCFPSRATLAKDVGVSARTIDQMIAVLINEGLLRKEGRFDENKQITNIYTVMVVVRGANPATPLAKSATPPVQNLRTELNPIRTLKGRDLGEVRSVPDSEETEKPLSVIPSPYSVEATREAWEGGERRLQILNWFFSEKGLWTRATNRARLKAMMQRHSKSAERIAKADWSPSELKKAKNQILLNEKMQDEWTLETIEKYLTK